MKKALAIVIALTLCAFAFTPQLAQGQGRGRGEILKVHKAIPGQYIVVLRDDVPKAGVAALANKLAHVYGGNLRHVYKHTIKGFSVQMPETAAGALSQNPQVEFVEEDGEASIVVAQQNATFGLDRIDQRSLPLNNTYIYSHTGAGVNAYVIDTGILPTHQEFGGRASAAYDALGGSGLDCNGHGTHVAGTVGGSTYGVAKQVNIYGVRVLDCSGNGFWSDVIAGVDWVTANHVKPAVANMSLGGGAIESVDAAVRRSLAAGVTYAIAAGNDNADASFYSPARVTEALTVGATDSSDMRSQFLFGGSNYGAVLDLFAPGSFITSAWHLSNTSINTISGTSMAAPHVAGVAALYLQSNPSASPATVNQALINNATPGKVIDPGPGSPNRLLYSIFNSAHDNRADFDLDYRTDISVFNAGEWRSRNSSNGQDVPPFYFGQSGDIPTPGDYNGDGRTDYAVFRPGNGTWYIATERGPSFYGVPFGLSGDIPVARDYDGDGKTDIAVFRPSNTYWYILNSRDNSWTSVQFGLGSDRLVPGDYDGDARADIAVFRPSNSTWYIRRADGTFYGGQFGVSSDLPVQADYDGDGLTDIAVFRPSNGGWYWLNSSDNAFQARSWGLSSDRPVPGDYDGDGKADVAVQRPEQGPMSYWHILYSSTGTYDSINFRSGFPVPGGYLTPLY